MNKLMIAAAAVAMVGAVQAEVIAKYDFVANLETTKGAAGEASWVKYHANLGVKNNVMWYDDEAFTEEGGVAEVIEGVGGAPRKWVTPANFPNIDWTVGTSPISGREFPAFVLKTSKVDGVDAVVLTQDESDFIEMLEAKYNEKSSGYWCCQIEWYLYTKAQCFRVSGTDTIDTEVYLTEQCCDSRVGGRFVDANGVAVIGWEFLNRFGAQNSDDADDVEIFAEVRTFAENNGLFFGALAGQGSLGEYEVKDTIFGDSEWHTVKFPAQISGKIVGMTAAPTCPDCCVQPLPKAIAFECLDSDEPDETLPTAAYGSFYLRIKDITGDIERQ